VTAARLRGTPCVSIEITQRDASARERKKERKKRKRKKERSKRKKEKRKRKKKEKRKEKERNEETNYVCTLYVAHSNYWTEFKAEIFPLNVSRDEVSQSVGQSVSPDRMLIKCTAADTVGGTGTPNCVCGTYIHTYIHTHVCA
jgi:sRNA-binding protein